MTVNGGAMRRSVFFVLLALFDIAIVTACGTSGNSQQPGGGGTRAAANPAAAAHAVNPCTLVGKEEVAKLITSAIATSEPLEGDPQTCDFKSEHGPIVHVTVRPGLGEIALSNYETGKIEVPVTPLPGVGDRALWQETLHEVIATKHGVLCTIVIAGPPGSAAADAQKREGDLCNTIFSKQ
jgi:hypothetical protein